MSTKTKAQLLAEIGALQKRLAELQAVEAESHQENDIYKKRAHALGERVKELNCLYGISRLVETPGISLAEILQGSVELLPPAWHYPKITCARITLDNQEYKTGNFRETEWKLASEIKVEGKRAGIVEVCYLEEQPKSDQGPFLKEERALIDAIAERLGRIIQRMQAQKSLLETRNYLESLITYANAPIIVWDPTLKITRFNRAFEQLTGYSANEVLNQELSMLFSETSRAESMSKIAGTVSGDYWESIEIPILHKNGEVSIVLWNSANIYAEDGIDLLATIAQGTDITERKQAEERINHLNLVLRAIRSVNQLIVREKNRDDLIQRVCDFLIETRGYTIAWIALFDASGGFLAGYESGLGKGFTSLLKELKRGEFPACIQQALARSGPIEITDPSFTCADCPIAGIYSDNGRMIIQLEHAEKVYGVLTVCAPTDFTVDDEELSLFEEVASDIAFALYNIELEENIKQAVQKLQDSAEYQKTIFETTSLATVIIEEDITLSMVNKEFENLSGYSKEELEGKMSWTEFVAAEDLKRMKDDHQQRRIDPDTTLKQYEFQFINREGIVSNILLHVNLIPGTKKSVASLLDITERFRAKQEIKMLLALSRHAGAETSLDDLLFFIASQIVEVIPPAETSSIFFYDEERKVIKIQAWSGFSDNDVKRMEFSVYGSLASRIFRNKKPVMINDSAKDPDFKMISKLDTDNIKSQICVPLIFKKRVIGIIFADNLTRVNAFSQKNLDLMESIGNQLAGVIENARLLDQLRENHKHLRQSEELYHSVVEDSPGLISRFLPDGTFTFVNQEACKFLGKKQDELIGINIQSTIAEEYRENVMSSIASLSTESPIRISENKNIKHDGEACWMRWTNRALFDDKGQIISYQAFGEDVTERVEAEQALRREKHQAQKYLDIAEVIMLVLNSKGEITLINQKGYKLLGYKKGELIGKNWFDTCVPERIRKEDKQVFKKNMSGGDELVEYYENPVVTKSGEERIIAWHHTNLWVWDENKQIIGTLSSGEDISERKRAEHLLNALNRAAVAMGKALTPEDIFSTVAKEFKQLDFSCMLFPIDKSQSKLFTKYLSYDSATLDTAEKLSGMKHEDFSITIDAFDVYKAAVREKKAVFIENSDEIIRQILLKFSKKLSNQIARIMRIPKSILAPLIVEDKVIGVFSAHSDDLTQEDLPAITAFAHQLAAAWNKIELLQNLQKTMEGTIHTIAATVEARDPYTAGHQRRVADLAVAIAIEMRLSKERVEGIRMAGGIHDLGKIQVPAEILNKPGKLSELEFNLIKNHSLVGFDLLKKINFPWPLAQMILQHHEKMDGSGYPQGLKGEEIMLEARILAVADVVEAISSHRPYRPAIGIEQALEEITQNRDTLYDPDVVDACLKVFEEGYKLLEN